MRRELRQAVGNMVLLTCLAACGRSEGTATSVSAAAIRRPEPTAPKQTGTWWRSGCGDIAPRMVGGATTPPVVLHRVAPDFGALRGRTTEATLVIIESVIGTDGLVCATHVLKRPSGTMGDELARRSVEAVQHLRQPQLPLQSRSSRQARPLLPDQFYAPWQELQSVCPRRRPRRGPATTGKLSSPSRPRR